MSNEEKNTPENEQQEGLLDKVTHAVDNAIDSATHAVEQVAHTVSGSAAEPETVSGEGADAETTTGNDSDTAGATAPATATAPSSENAPPPAAPQKETSKEAATSSQKKGDRNERKTRDGIVVSNKMDKTISVMIERRLQHPIYGKYVKKSKKLIAHDETNQCQIGDLVRIMECRPLSRRKRWRLISVLEQAK